MIPTDFRVIEEVYEWKISEYRSLNLHRGILCWTPSRHYADYGDMNQEIRQKVKDTYRIGWLRGFAFGVILELERIPLDIKDLGEYIDERNKANGVWQWVIVVGRRDKEVVGIQTWMKNRMTPIYDQFLYHHQKKGYNVNSFKRDESVGMHLLTLFGRNRVQETNAQRLKPDTVVPNKHPLVRGLKPVAQIIAALGVIVFILEILVRIL